MKTTTTNSLTNLAKAGKLFCLSLAMAVTAMTTVTAQRAATPITSETQDITSESMKNPGTGQQPVKNIVPGPITFCPALTGLHMVDKSYGHIVMGWDNVVHFDSIMFRVTETGTSNSRIISIPGNPNPGRTFLQGLTGLTTYDIEMRTKCSNGTLTNWTTPMTITTFAEPAPRLYNGRNSNMLTVSPNPASGSTVVRFLAPAHVQHQVRIITSTGQPVMKTVVTSPDGKIQLPIDLTGFAPGLYYVQVQSGATIFSERLVIL